MVQWRGRGALRRHTGGLEGRNANVSPGPAPLAGAPPMGGQGGHRESTPPPPSSTGLPLVSLVLGGCGLAGYLLGVAHGHGLVVFFLTGLGIMPWARLLGLATEALALHIGPVAGALVMTFFGNAPELIIGGIAVRQGQGAVVQARIAGSILSNALLVVGCVFVIGGWTRDHVSFSRLATSTSVTQLALALLGLLIPAAFVLSGGADARPETVQHLSLAVAVILITCYVGAQVFALRTHRHLFMATADVDAEEHAMTWGWQRATLVLLVSTLVIGALAETLVSEGLPALIDHLGWSTTFVGVVLVALIGNAAELFAAVGAARHGKLELAVRVGIEGAGQVALLMGPFLILLSAVLGAPIDLAFPGLLVLAVTAAVFILHLVAEDGEGTWLEGM